MPSYWDDIVTGSSKNYPYKRGDILDFYTARHLAKGWAPERVNTYTVRNLAQAYSRLKRDKKLSRLAQDPYIFLANALTEGRERMGLDYGVNMVPFGTPANSSYNEYVRSGYPGAKEALMYGLWLSDKTGSYADQVYRNRGISPSNFQRIALWNGKGAGADNHARKVLSMAEQLKNPKNKAIWDEFSQYSNPDVWGFKDGVE